MNSSSLFHVCNEVCPLHQQNMIVSNINTKIVKRPILQFISEYIIESLLLGTYTSGQSLQMSSFSQPTRTRCPNVMLPFWIPKCSGSGKELVTIDLISKNTELLQLEFSVGTKWNLNQSIDDYAQTITPHNIPFH